MNLGLSGRLTQATIRSPLTPLALLAAIALGLLAVITIPREEEPQISVPLVDVQVRADGVKAVDAIELITKPLEAIIKSIDDVEHIYSQTEDDGVLVTARFKVGTDPDDAIVRVHEKIRANYDRIPAGIPEPLIVARGINDVPIVVVTLTPKPEAADRWTDQALYDVSEICSIYPITPSSPMGEFSDEWSAAGRKKFASNRTRAVSRSTACRWVR